MNALPPEEKLNHFLGNPAMAFTILVLGERGTGKTSKVMKVAKSLRKEVVQVNCASFSDDTMAESELFGYEKGAFTGADRTYPGLFKKAKGNILFLDEIHSLSRRVQQKLMTSLQTTGEGKNKGKFGIRPLGGDQVDYVELRPVFASNLEIKELRKCLMPDFYDRISQLIVRFPSIKEQEVSVYEEFCKVWTNMQFKDLASLPKEALIGEWLSNIALPGNYRNLETIAINWHQGRLILKEDKEENETEVFHFVKNQISLSYDSTPIQREKNPFNFQKGSSKKAIETNFRQALYDWAVSDLGYGNLKKAAEGLDFQSLHLWNQRKKS